MHLYSVLDILLVTLVPHASLFKWKWVHMEYLHKGLPVTGILSPCHQEWSCDFLLAQQFRILKRFVPQMIQQAGKGWSDKSWIISGKENCPCEFKG